MRRNLTACASALVVILLCSSDAGACGKRRATNCNYATYSGCATSSGYAAAPYYATPGAPGYGYAGGGYGYNPSGYGYNPSGYDFGRPGYNPGGLGGPASGLGVRPGMGVGGFGPRR